ncbi:MAG: signal peptidase I, partial [Acidimicrobiia bacterium]
GREFVLKGDANEEADPLPVRVDKPYKVIAEVPKAGRVAAYSATPLGGFALGISIAGALLLPGRFRRAKEARR